MKKLITLFSMTILLLILDNSFVPFIAIKGYSPSLLFLFIISYSIINESWEGLWLGVISGLFQDLYFSNIIGINAFANMLSCVIAGFIGINIFKEKILIPVISSFFLSIFKGFTVFVILYCIGISMGIKIIFLNALYNMIVSIPMYKFVYWLCSKEYMQRKWKF
ncbi:rod shape-determining protein MreD [Clostridium liquoris]|jgi:rod shape-determining protein MreD|uniref:Rod shape-determining protein MreD n=1 Tax=Clostridium liquoris TaxID=1289519 RepID=A0A2T0B119_9CLOT|nr:rod shape-determining protein MreD [Clostridium liquoris]PRR77304.1 rod shape-determining protein MreD [Clostridium liquoris]